MSVMEDTMMAGAVAAEKPGAAVAVIDAREYLNNEREVWLHNLAAMRVDSEALDAFLELAASCDMDYMSVGDHACPEPELEPAVDWESVDAALTESQQILICVQQLLSQILEEMGVDDHHHIHVYADTAGLMRLVSEHERREEIEAALNSPANSQFRGLYHAAASGMSTAGGLVGWASLPKEVLEKIKAKYCASGAVAARSA